MLATSPFLIALLLLGLSQPTAAALPAISFNAFLKNYLQQSAESLGARRQLSSAQRLKVERQDQWTSRLEATENLSFEKQSFESGGRPDNSNRTNSLSGQFIQNMPTGTKLEVGGQKFIETQNPLFNSIDRRYSAKLTQDLIRNSFGKSQRALMKQGQMDFKVAELEYRQSIVNSCEDAFSLYADAYIQQEIADLLQAQLKDAQKAVNVSRKLFKDRLINKVDQLTSENDFIDTRLQVEQAQQKLLNTKRQIQAFIESQNSLDFILQDPSDFLPEKPELTSSTLPEEIIALRLKSQNFNVEKARSDRWTELQFGVEVGENFGRLALNGPLVNYNEQFLRANLTVGFDLLNNTEDAQLKNAVFQKNSLEKERHTLNKTQKNKIESLIAMNTLLSQQVTSSAKQVQLLEEKMRIAFNQMKRAKLDFQNYLLHRNAYLNQQRTFLNLKKDLWLNRFALQKEYAHQSPQLCEVAS